MTQSQSLHDLYLQVAARKRRHQRATAAACLAVMTIASGMFAYALYMGAQ